MLNSIRPHFSFIKIRRRLFSSDEVGPGFVTNDNNTQFACLLDFSFIYAKSVSNTAIFIFTAKEVHKAPVFIEKLQNTGVSEGFPVRLECRISGEPSPQIFWKKENESITHNTDRVR